MDGFVQQRFINLHFPLGFTKLPVILLNIVQRLFQLLAEIQQADLLLIPRNHNAGAIHIRTKALQQRLIELQIQLVEPIRIRADRTRRRDVIDVVDRGGFSQRDRPAVLQLLLDARAEGADVFGIDGVERRGARDHFISRRPVAIFVGRIGEKARIESRLGFGHAGRIDSRVI